MKRLSIWIGFDPRETAAFAVARETARQHVNGPIPIRGVVLDELKAKGLYTRPTEQRLGKTWDVISGAYNSTEFSVSRFLVPHLARSGWALFMDCDVLVRGRLDPLLHEMNPEKAVYVVKHQYEPQEEEKMDGQVQSNYHRKNWSSVCLWNVDHPANKNLTVDIVNCLPGRDLHGFKWLQDKDIGELPPEYNYLVGHTKINTEPKVVHFTEGGPWFTGFEKVEYADEWRAALNKWAANG